MNPSQKATRSISVIGLGAMGAGIARTLMDQGCQVSVWNRSRPKMAPLVSEGAIPCQSPRDALDANTYVVVCVSDYAGWRNIIDTHA